MKNITISRGFTLKELLAMETPCLSAICPLCDGHWKHGARHAGIKPRFIHKENCNLGIAIRLARRGKAPLWQGNKS